MEKPYGFIVGLINVACIREKFSQVSLAVGFDRQLSIAYRDIAGTTVQLS